MVTIEDLDKRVTALEKAQRETAETQTWMAQTLGRIAAVQDEHTKILKGQTVAIGDVQTDLQGLQAEMREVKADLKGLRADLPVMLVEAVREGLKQG